MKVMRVVGWKSEPGMRGGRMVVIQGMVLFSKMIQRSCASVDCGKWMATKSKEEFKQFDDRTDACDQSEEDCMSKTLEQWACREVNVHWDKLKSPSPSG